jgi:hypothetical protein
LGRPPQRRLASFHGGRQNRSELMKLLSLPLLPLACAVRIEISEVP